MPDISLEQLEQAFNAVDPWFPLHGIADWYEEYDSADMAWAYRWLIRNRRWPLEARTSDSVDAVSLYRWTRHRHGSPSNYLGGLIYNTLIRVKGRSSNKRRRGSYNTMAEAFYHAAKAVTAERVRQGGAELADILKLKETK